MNVTTRSPAINDLVVAAMAAGGHQTVYNSVQVQKLFFLIDREMAELVGGPHFNFKPFHYGPYDGKVYDVLRLLADRNLVKVAQKDAFSIYTLTAQGQQWGKQVLTQLGPAIQDILTQCARWVRAQSFRSLLIAIYMRYPDMAENSHVPDLVELARRRRLQSPARSFAMGASTILDLYPRSDTTRTLEPQAALAADWHAIGDDLREKLAPFPFST